jgi:hypothetical protein
MSTVFSGGQKALYVLSAPVCILFGLIIWKLAKRPLDENESLMERFNWLYSIAAGALVVKLLTNVLPHSMLQSELGGTTIFAYYALAVAGMGISFLCMVYVQQCARVWHSNETYITPSTVIEHQEPLLNGSDVTENSHIRVTDLRAFREQVIQGQDIIKDKTKRRVIVAVLYWTIVYLTVLDGFFAVYWSDKSPAGAWGIAGLSWISRLFDSCIIYCGLVHALIHTLSKRRWYKWLFAYSTLSAIWFVTLILSTLPALTNMTVEQATFIVQYNVWSFFYGLGGGVLLWMTTYFTWISGPAPTRASVRRKLIIGTSVIVVGILVGIFI